MWTENLFLSLLALTCLMACFLIGAIFEELYHTYKRRGKLHKEYVKWSKR